MRHPLWTAVVLTAVACAAAAQTGGVLTGKAALGGWRTDAPGIRRQL